MPAQIAPTAMEASSMAAIAAALGSLPSSSTMQAVAAIAPEVTKGNETLLNWINEEIKSLAGEEFFHKDYEETLADTYGLDYEESLVVEGGEPTV